MKILLRLDGIFSYFPTRKLTAEEIESCEYMRTVGLTPDGPEWDPYDSAYANQEDSRIDFRGDVIVPEPKRRKILDD